MLHLDNVSVTYAGGVVALQPTSLTFYRRQFTVLLGLSGAGKSTLLRTLNYLVRPNTGAIAVDGLGNLDAKSVLRAHRRQTAMIFQQHQLIARFTALQNTLIGRIGFHSSLKTLLPFPRQDRELALECLDRVGLLDKALERADNLSGGQQQRVGIARALVQHPKLMLADEPVASLDPATSRRVMKLFKDVCTQNGIPAVVSLHQIEIAKEFADRIIGLSNGRIVFDGLTQHLTDHDLEKIYTRLPGTDVPQAGDLPAKASNPWKELEIVR